MARFGIHDFRPQWLNGRDGGTAATGRRLARLAGRTLQHAWAAWDLDADEWLRPGPGGRAGFDQRKVGRALRHVEHHRPGPRDRGFPRQSRLASKSHPATRRAARSYAVTTRAARRGWR